MTLCKENVLRPMASLCKNHVRMRIALRSRKWSHSTASTIADPWALVAIGWSKKIHQ